MIIILVRGVTVTASRVVMAKDYGFNQIGNLIAGRGERPFAPTEEWRTAVRPYRRMAELFNSHS